MEGKKPALPVFTSFRFFAALAVVASHWCPHFLADKKIKALYDPWAAEGFAGVAFFFMLSGFILAYNYADSFRRLTLRGLRDFYVSRFARVYPVHVLTFLLMFIATPLVVGQFKLHRPQLLANLFLVQSYFPDREYYFSQNAVSWSLGDEFFFYFMFPFVMAAFLSFRLRSSAVIGLSILAWVGALCLGYAYRSQPAASHWPCYIFPLSRFSEFLIGVAIAWCTVCRPATPFARKRRALITTLLELASLTALALAVRFSHHVPMSYRYGSYYTPFMACIILAFTLGNGWASRVLAVRPLRFLGEISYSIYMFHVIILLLFLKNRDAWGLASYGPMRLTATYLATVIAVSALCYWCFETPMRIGVRAMLTAKRKEVTAGPTEVGPVRIAA